MAAEGAEPVAEESHESRAAAMSPPAPARTAGTAAPAVATLDPLAAAIERTQAGSMPLPITLITGVPARPGLLGPLFTHIARRLRARRPWGWQDRLAAGHTMLANMVEAVERGDLDGAVRYLNALLLDDALAEVERPLFLPLWNVDPDDPRSWNAFRALAGLVTLALKHRRCVLHLVATAQAGRARVAEREFDLVVPLENLALNAYDVPTCEALKAAAGNVEAPRERDLRLHLPIVQIRQRNDELTLGVRAPIIETPRGLGSLFKLGAARQREEEQLTVFGRQAVLTAFRWDPFLQYVDLTLLREDRGVRRAVLELKAERSDYAGANSDTQAA